MVGWQGAGLWQRRGGRAGSAAAGRGDGLATGGASSTRCGTRRLRRCCARRGRRLGRLQGLSCLAERWHVHTTLANRLSTHLRVRSPHGLHVRRWLRVLGRGRPPKRGLTHWLWRLLHWLPLARSLTHWDWGWYWRLRRWTLDQGWWLGRPGPGSHGRTGRTGRARGMSVAGRAGRNGRTGGPVGALASPRRAATAIRRRGRGRGR